MPKYRKKPVIVDASRWREHGDHPNVTVYNPEGKSGPWPCPECGGIKSDHGWIKTLEGGHIVCPGDWIITDVWIITGVRNEQYPCKNDVFEQTYERVEEEAGV